jgi:hypothetical protein
MIYCQQLVGGRVASRASLVVAAGAVLSSAANILEDGPKMEWAFFAFVLGAAITLIGLLALTIAIVARGGQRHFALVPVGTMAGLLLFVIAGGPVMLATWLVAARARRRASAQASGGRAHNVLAGPPSREVQLSRQGVTPCTSWATSSIERTSSTPVRSLRHQGNGRHFREESVPICSAGTGR